ncbi:hypothetical protein PGT21_006508 [Puccinia graminis f. sp. tritici]|uniref:Secreted protein n=1 Tax=Puccinia graminis f. sp. tritici TaxID=56615 RepID=A0A5B0QA79_PUCGR|nr:hypothetical protein PGT21_006508 [Puccinia graminis f. sp. tritici]
MSKTKNSILRAWIVSVITLVTFSIQLSAAQNSLWPRSGTWAQCWKFLEINHNGPAGTLLCGTFYKENYQCNKCNSGEGPDSDPQQHPFSQMTWYDCHRNAERGIRGGEHSLTGDFSYTCPSSAQNDHRPYCRECTLV